jgi:AraC-like DNA-binding protein
MRAKYLQVIPNPGQSFHLRKEAADFFDNPWHFHPELELNWIIEGRGTRFVGDDISRFESDDMILLGSMLPHYWRCDPEYYLKDDSPGVEAVILRFSPDQLGLVWNQTPELKFLYKSIEKAKNGICLTGSTKDELKTILLQMLVQGPAERYICLLRILRLVAEIPSPQTLCSSGFQLPSKNHDEQRLRLVYDFIFSRYEEPIGLQDLAELVHMESSSFSRFFKKGTGKTFSRFLAEIRIGHACRMLIETDYTISRILLESGFHNQSNFNQIFKSITGISPKEFRNENTKSGYSGSNHYLSNPKTRITEQ